MQIEILDSSTQQALMLAAAVLAVGAGLAWKFARNRGFAPLAAGAMITLGLLFAEQVALLVARGAAPSSEQFNEYHWIMLAPWGRLGLALGCAAAGLTVLLGWKATARVQSPLRRAALFGLRTGGVAAALVLFLEPALELRQVAREPNRIAVLVDDSQSMALRDGASAPTRAELIRAVVTGSADTFERWRHNHILDFYTFSSTLDTATEQQVATGEPTGPASLLRVALEQTRARYDGRDLAGIIILSDGTATGDFRDGAADGSSREFLQSLDTKVHTVWIGKPGIKDVAVSRLLADEFAFARTVVKVEAVIRTNGYAKQRIPVSLSTDGKLIRQKWIDLKPGSSEAVVAFEFTPPRVGKFVYEIATPVQPDEAVATNNTRAFVLRVIRDKIRVLQVAGQPSWDVRALRLMLKQNPNVDLISFFILRTGDDLSMVPPEEMSLIPFPTRELFSEQLPSFDLIVLQNFNYRDYGIEIYLENIRRYVEGGGGLIMLGGRLSFSSGLYAGTPVAKALPIKLLPNNAPPSQLLDVTEFVPKLTGPGRHHPITALRYEDADNDAAWKALLPLEGTNIVGDARPGATVLATHPKLTTRSGKPMPIIATGEYHQGRVMVVTTDSLWKWGFVAAGTAGDAGRTYHKLWENAIRWSIQDPELRYLHVETDAPEYFADSPLHLEARLQNRDYSPKVDGVVQLQIQQLSGTSVGSAQVTTDETGRGTHQLAGLPAGVYRVEATAEIGELTVRATDLFLVRPGSAELHEPAAQAGTLQAISTVTGGKFLGRIDSLPENLEFDPPRIVRVDRRADIELWSQPWLLAAALLLLGLEWGLRQRGAGL